MDKKGYSLFQASKELAINPKTAYRWAKLGIIKANRLPTGHSYVSEDEVARVKAIIMGKVLVGKGNS